MARNELTTFICLFHSPDHAESALSALENAGFNRNSVTSTWKGAEENAQDRRSELTEIGVPERDLDRLVDGLSKGGVVLSLEAPDKRSDEIERIFHKYSADKIDETDRDRAPAVPAGHDRPIDYEDSAVVPIAEEELVVGKREVSQGGVRVFRRTVEEPVSESLNLHEEHVIVERRPVDRAVTRADYAAGEQDLELTETEEIAVVNKVARVVEEVRVGVVGSEHTERVEGNVRHTEVEVESVPGSDVSNANRNVRDSSGINKDQR